MVKKKLALPRLQYGPMCSKILKQFIEHHKLPEDLPIPTAGMKPEEALSRIFDVMLFTFGKEKRDAVLKDVEEYCNSLPPSLR